MSTKRLPRQRHIIMVDVDSHESALLSAVNVARQLAPMSARLKQLTEPINLERT